jgi:5-methylcytosine-specific restriction protein A
MITNNVLSFRDAFLSEQALTDKATKDLNSWKLIVYDLPKLIKVGASLNDLYLVNGSIGKGLISETPWIGVFDTEITKSAQNGYYIVYLFKADLTGVYLSLNQGWTQYETEYGVKLGKEKIVENAKRAQNLLRSTSSFSFEPIDLKATKTLAKGYELGNICSKYYDLDKLPKNDTFIDDLRNLIGTYRELKGLVGNDILDIKSKVSEDEFQKVTQTGKIKILPDGLIKRKEKSVSEKKTSSWSRDSDISFTALTNASFKCENNIIHETFISAKTGHQFVEAHHLIPMEFQNDFENSLDVPENIISLCPNCHRGFHLAEESYRNNIVLKFHNKRRERLDDRGIYVSSDKLLSFYKVIVEV